MAFNSTLGGVIWTTLGDLSMVSGGVRGPGAL